MREIPSLVTLTTDFGDSQGYVGVMKGVMASINPKTNFVDIAHDVPAHDILHGGFVLKTAYSFFPSGTVHLGVVDPGVGGSRRAIVARTEKYSFVGPDNGLFTFVFTENEYRVWEIAERKYTLGVTPTTFDGRDVFAPVASYLSLGVSIEEFGPEVYDPVMLPVSKPVYDEREASGEVIHVDRFGNLITNIEMSKLNRKLISKNLRVSVGGLNARGLYGSYSDAPEGELFCLWGSHGFLEVALNKGRAADTLQDVDRGSRVVLELED